MNYMTEMTLQFALDHGIKPKDIYYFGDTKTYRFRRIEPTAENPNVFNAWTLNQPATAPPLLFLGHEQISAPF